MFTILEGVPHISAEIAAARLGTTGLKILMLIKEGKLAGTTVNGAWFVTDSSVARYLPTLPETQTHQCRTGCSGCGGH